MEEAWGEFERFASHDCPSVRTAWREDVEALFRRKHVPRLLVELSQPRQVLVKTHDLSKDNWRDTVESSYVHADREGYTFGGYPDFMSEEARTTPFDWPALTALSTSNAGARKPLNKRDNPSAGASGDAKRKRGGGGDTTS